MTKAETLGAALRVMRLRIGNPSTREIASRTTSSHTTVAELLRGIKIPRRWEAVAAIVEALQGDPEQIKPLWLAAMEDVYSARIQQASEIAARRQVEVWRTGRRVGRTIYRQRGSRPSGADPLIGVMDTPELAALVVRAVNGGNWILNDGVEGADGHQG